ncbi:1,5-anhydro-D-fructose reductase isoform X2 [Onthophagus taurus]|uniref:1,5-anhydro-D-fructose reductase isoform X2 n=1 Tax=Onthophagus taurus TaxID=166361 RepID=UPI0039BDA7BB
MANSVENVLLSTGNNMPILGFGTWQAKDDELESALDAALEAGYRHIDTAYVYENEKVIGRVLKKWLSSKKIKREDLFIVTKVPPSGNYPDGVRKYIKKSLENLQLDYLDLYLVHVPFQFRDVEGDLHPMTSDGRIDAVMDTDHIAIWKAMEEQFKNGLTRSIGISNFNVKQIQRILDNSEIKPSNLQIELHAYMQQNELVDFCKKNNIVVTAYSPLGAPGLGKFLAQFGQTIEIPDILGNPTVTDLAKKHNKTNAQILLRYTIQKGIVVIPKSTNPKRIKENFDVFDFQLDDGDMKKMKALDKGNDARILNFSGAFPGIDSHPEFPY